MRATFDTAALDAALQKNLFFYDLPGLSVRIEQHDQSWHGVAGFQTEPTKQPLLDTHIFHMASVTKTLVGTCVLRLYEHGLIDLDAPLTRYFPDFRMKDGRSRDITIRHLLTHTSGMPDVEDYHWEAPETDEGALFRYVTSPEVTEASLLWSPQENRFAYSNIGYEILGHVISLLLGKPFETCIDEWVLQPAGMRDSTLRTFERDMNRVASPHEKDSEHHFFVLPHFPYNRAHAPSSTLTAPLKDLSSYAKAIESGALLSNTTKELAFTVHADVPNNGEKICLSWFSREQNGYRLWGHEGTDDGFRSSFWLCPELSLSITVCSNISGAPVKKINKQFFDLITLIE